LTTKRGYGEACSQKKTHTPITPSHNFGVLFFRTAQAQGKVLGRKPKTNDEQRQAIKVAHGAEASVSALVREYGISRASILNIVS
jgi:hypothetical protein